VTPQSLGLPATGQEVRVNSTTTMIFEGFNENVNIVLPSVAGRAQPFPPGLAASNEAVPVASNGSEIGPNESVSNATRLNELIPNITKLDESKSRLNESVSRLNKSMPDDTMQEKRTIQAASTPWRIFL